MCVSLDNCRLFIGVIFKEKKKEEILDEMKKVIEGVVDVIVYLSVIDKIKNCGFVFVEYEFYRVVVMVRRKLILGKIDFLKVILYINFIINWKKVLVKFRILLVSYIMLYEEE